MCVCKRDTERGTERGKECVCVCACLCAYINISMYSTGEVSDVAWSATEFWKLASSSDDTTVRVWTIDRAMSAHMQTQSEVMRESSGSGGVGFAEVPQSWSQPVLQSEEDRLTCHETMMFSDTVSSSQEPDYCEEDRSSASAILGSSADSPTGQQTISRLSPISPPEPSVMTGEINSGGSGGGALATPTTVARNNRIRSSLGDDRGLNNRSPQSRQALLTAFFNPRMSALVNSDDTLVRPSSSTPTEVTSPSGAGAGGSGGDRVTPFTVNAEEEREIVSSPSASDSRKRSRTHH